MSTLNKMDPKDQRNTPPSATGGPGFNTTSTTSQLQVLPTQSVSTSPIPLPDKTEREGYYYGLFSRPLLLARTSRTTWALPVGPYNYPERKVLKNVSNHKIMDKWDDAMAMEVFGILETYSVQWTTVELFRIGSEEQKDIPVVLWIGVRPGTLTDEDGASLPAAGIVALACKRALEKHNILDVECEIKECNVYRGAGPVLARPSTSWDPTEAVDIEVFFTPTIGTCIAPEDQTREGTFGFYVTFPEHPGKVYGVTCRHVLLPPVEQENKTYHHNDLSQPPRLVVLPGDGFLDILRQRAVREGKSMTYITESCRRTLDDLAEHEDQDALRAKKHAQGRMERAQQTIGDFDRLVKDLDTTWKTLESRVVGHVAYAPPIRADNKSHNYTLDWCLYEVDPMKIKNFAGNVIDLGYRSDEMAAIFYRAMNPSTKNSYEFEYPFDRQWPIRDMCIPLDEMKHPKTFGKDGTPAILVVKRGRTTGVTCGIANEIDSYVRTYLPDASSYISKEWAILGLDESNSPFSALGDSGSLVVDAQGRMGGMLTGGSGFSRGIGITYATPMVALLADMEKCGWRQPNTSVAP